MAEFEAIKNQLQSFIRKYQLNFLIKGVALFVLIGLVFLLLLLSFENYIWFDSGIRFFLFLSFVIIESALLIFFVGLPLLKVLDLKRAISDKEAAILIGNYFPEIDDRLLNLIELKSQNNSEFLEAAIRQKSSELKFYNFKNAVNFVQYRNYMLAAFIPVLLIISFVISGKGEWLFSSFNRIKNYDQVYEKPAPFSFVLNTEDLHVIEGEDYLLEVNVIGEEIPQQLKIVVEDAEYFMKALAPGRFSYVFRNVAENQQFRLKSTNISSKTYNLDLIPVPELVSFTIDINYPEYLNRESEQISGDGNLSIPEGTSLQWNFKHHNTDHVNLQFKDSLLKVDKSFVKVFTESSNYSLSTSNSFLDNYQELYFQIEVIKDRAPQIQVEEKLDSLDTSQKFYGGKVSDDYGISRLLLRYRKIGSEKFDSKSIKINNANISQFYTSFPGELELEEGSNYEYYFQVFDNDEVNGSKSASSQYFTFYEKTSEEIEDENLDFQENNIDNLSEEFDKFQQEEDLNNLLNDQLENKEFDYEQRQKLESFIKSQERENALMEKFTKNIQEKLEESNPEDKDAENLKNRLENSQSKLEDNKKLLEELKKYSDKIQNENLQQKLEKLSKNKNSSKRSLEQLVELTKQYYVEQKYNQLVEKLKRLGEEQENLDNSENSQEEINAKFGKIQDDLDELQEKNNDLKRPKSLERNQDSEESIKQDLEELNSDSKDMDQDQKKKKQQNTGKKMKELAEEMSSNSGSLEMQVLQADIETLRKVLDNLVIFSFEQEQLMNDFSSIQADSPEYSKHLKEQYLLKENFEHVDDSLFTLGLNNEFIADKVFELLEDVSFNLNNSLEELAEVRVSKSLASQQYTITGANDLAVMLSGILNNMNDQMNSSGSGGGDSNGPQLPDIMEQQQELGIDIQEEMEKGQNGNQEQNGEGQQSKLFEIYKRQEEIRKNLENVLKENGMDLNDLNKDYDQLENDILNNDLNQNSLNNLERINQKMLDLNQSLNEKGEREERESETNRRQFDNQSTKEIIDIKDYFNSIEILDRQTLPLRPNLKQRINTYFNE
ncbi:ring-infected erythrocyte surface antigen domain-containing protein [Zunongwangia atlantica]|uniref:Glutamyl-tRNA synthetase n=1 Tax=Zunongwangia atlantica 22II14-10F7 TaxID=1185767 RepID=A0A1Y1T2G6_9FLAO|nr:hypothetical protein [Zunongwangia atlantica]ORL45220.1 hypothetical protein IIF7_12232 [Zunongwangia atlantica 22II14-10F7]